MNSTFNDYISTYSARCGDNDSNWFQSWGFVATFTHSISIFTFPFHVYTAWCIIYKTPSKMSGSKWNLLNLHLWQSSFDFLICSLVTPYFFFPCMCGFPIGILRVLGVPTLVQLFLGQVSLSGVVASLVVIIESRHNNMVETRFKMTRPVTRRLFYTALYLYAFLFLLPMYFENPEQNNNKLKFLKQYPCPPVEFFDENNFFFTTKPEILVLRSFIFVSINLSIGCYFFIHCLIFIRFGPQTFKISKNTRNAQLVAFYHLMLGGAIPIVILSIPALFYGISIVFNYYNQVLNNIGTISLSFHGLCATSCITFCIPPYRAYTLKLFGLDRRGKVGPKNVSVVFTSGIHRANDRTTIS